jgi:hypothetical protein
MQHIHWVSFMLGGFSYYCSLSAYQWLVGKFRRAKANISLEGTSRFHVEWLEGKTMTASDTVDMLAGQFYEMLRETLGNNTGTIPVNSNDFQISTLTYDIKSTIYKGKFAALAKEKALKDARANRS